MNAVEFSGAAQTPSKVVCVGRNYMEHISELGNQVPEQMVLFFKPNSSISSELRAIDSEQLHYEAEICLGVEAGEFRYVGFGLDLTKRGLQSELKERGLPWERSKAFRGAAVLSHFVAIDSSINSLQLELWIDGELAQKGGVAEMINKPNSILEEVRSFVDLEDYDVVMTGTPRGVGAVKEGALFEGVILREGEELLRHSWQAQG